MLRSFLADNLDRRRLRAAGRPTAPRDGAARARVQAPGPRARRPRPARRLRARPDPRACAAPTAPVAARPGAAAARASPAATASSTACAGSSAGPTTTWSSRSPIRSCGCASPRCCAARAGAAARARCASASSRSTRSRARSRLRGARVELAQKEFALLRALACEPTRVFTKEELLRDVWGFRSLGAHAHAGLARLPPAAQARRAGRPLRDQRVGRRLPARRRAGAA